MISLSELLSYCGNFWKLVAGGEPVRVKEAVPAPDDVLERPVREGAARCSKTRLNVSRYQRRWRTQGRRLLARLYLEGLASGWRECLDVVERMFVYWPPVWQCGYRARRSSQPQILPAEAWLAGRCPRSVMLSARAASN